MRLALVSVPPWSLLIKSRGVVSSHLSSAIIFSMLDVTKCARSVQSTRSDSEMWFILCSFCPTNKCIFFVRSQSLLSIRSTLLATLLVNICSRPILSDERDKKLFVETRKNIINHSVKIRTYEGTILSFCSLDTFAWSFANKKVHRRVTIGCTLEYGV